MVKDFELDERFELCREKIQDINIELNNEVVNEVVNNEAMYFRCVAKYIDSMLKIYDEMSDDTVCKDISYYENNNSLMYKDMTENYENSFLNPDYSCEKLGKTGKILSFLYAEISAFPAYVYEKDLFNIVILIELFIEVYGLYTSESLTEKAIHEAVYYHFYDYTDCLVRDKIITSLVPEMNLCKRIIMEEDLTDISYLYKYGEYISESEIKIAKFMNSLSDEEVEKMAETYTQGYKRGFKVMGVDMTGKKTVSIRCNIGFERMVRAAINQFAAMGLETIINRYSLTRVCRRQIRRIGLTGIPANNQFDFDHRMDDTVFLDSAFVDRRLNVEKNTYEEYKEAAKEYAGPAVIEIFGEKGFDPVIKKGAYKYSDKNQKLMVQMLQKSSEISNEYIKGDEISFTIIAYPIPDIGEDFEGIFKDTVIVNTLDNDKYTRIQQSIIDVLDTAEYVWVLGEGDNKTDIKVMLHTLNDPDKETNFENCVADVNIPVGEVFTSPILTGTNGILNVSHAYLNGLVYKNLSIKFIDGKIAEYTCDNFEDEKDNKDYIKENILFNHETLPIGEFAIGTNTTAYKMAKKYDIWDKLPILIGEKTGPHFAVGDTCYSHSEDHKVYNPNGKEIIARENEVSALRNTEVDKAYFNCHTDITIPYEELKAIYAVKKNGEKTAIILDGKFALPETEELNDSLK